MVTTTVEKTVVIANDGTPLSVMERPEGLGAFADYHKRCGSTAVNTPICWTSNPSTAIFRSCP